MKTPRSDEAKTFTEPHGYEMVPYCLARQLEIERNELADWKKQAEFGMACMQKERLASPVPTNEIISFYW